MRYGDGELRLSDEWESAVWLEPPELAPCADVGAELRGAVESPLAADPLSRFIRPDDTVVVVIGDTGLFPSLLPHLLPYLCPARSVNFLLTSIVTSIPEDEEAVRAAIDATTGGKYPIFAHVPDQRLDMIYLGRTRFGNEVQVSSLLVPEGWEGKLGGGEVKVIAIGVVAPDCSFGFSGGAEVILPGCASSVTIGHTRQRSFSEQEKQERSCSAGEMHNNPCYVDALDAVRLMDSLFTIDVVPASAGGVAKIFAGETEAAHDAACEFFTANCLVQSKQRFEVALISAGGTPNDSSLRNALNVLTNSFGLLYPDATVILLAACGDGLNTCKPLEQFDYLKRQNLDIILVSELSDPVLRQLSILPVVSVEAALEFVRAKHGDGFIQSSCVLPDGSAGLYIAAE